MLLLAIEQSTSTCSIALMRDGAQIDTRRWDDGLNQRQRLFSVIPELLADHQLDAADIDQFVVGTGPGSFAGIRIAIAACHGLAQPSHTPVSGLSSAALLAWQELKSSPDERVLVVGDARRGKFWCATYALRENGITTLQHPQLIQPETLGDLLDETCVLLSPDLDRIGEALQGQAEGRCRLVDEKSVPNAQDLAQLAHTQLAEEGTLPPPTPIYLHPAVFVAPRFPTPNTPPTH